MFFYFSVGFLLDVSHFLVTTDVISICFGIFGLVCNPELLE